MARRTECVTTVSMIQMWRRLLRAVIPIALGLMLCLNGSCSAGLLQPHVAASGQLIYANAVVVFTDAMTREQRLNFLEGAEMWKFALHDAVSISEVPLWELGDVTGTMAGGRCRLVVLVDVVKSNDKMIQDRDKKEKVSTLGLTLNHTCNVTKIWMVYDRLDDDADFVNVSAHEFGHALGLRHVESKRSIMHDFYSFDDPVSCITREDARELCNHYDCTVSRVRNCG